MIFLSALRLTAVVLNSARFLRTELLGGIHHVRWGHLQALHLPPELLQLLVLQLPPPAEQVEVDPLSRLYVKAHQHAVVTLGPCEGGVNGVDTEGETAALEGNVD